MQLYGLGLRFINGGVVFYEELRYCCPRREAIDLMGCEWARRRGREIEGF
jgi:hypothetical protein